MRSRLNKLLNICRLKPDESELFRAIRFEAVTLHPEAFADTRAEVTGYSEEKMRDFVGPSDDFPQKFVLGAFDGEALHGVAAFFREESDKEKHRGYVWSVYVRAQARGRGISRALMLELISQARQIDGLEFLALDVAMTQIEARSLYDSLGFEVMGINRFAYKLEDRYIDSEFRLLKL